MKARVGMVCEVEDLIEDGWLVSYDKGKDTACIKSVQDLPYLLTTRVLVQSIDHNLKMVIVSPHPLHMGVD